MNVQQLINLLKQVENKEAPVTVLNRYQRPLKYKKVEGISVDYATVDEDFNRVTIDLEAEF